MRLISIRWVTNKFVNKSSQRINRPFSQPKLVNQLTYLTNVTPTDLMKSLLFTSFLPSSLSLTLVVSEGLGQGLCLQQRCTTLFAQGPQRMIFRTLEGRWQNYELSFRGTSIPRKKTIF